MRGLFFLFFLHTILFSSSVLDSKIYERDNRVDLLLSFDKMFEGSVSKHIKDKKTYIIITDAVAKEDEVFSFKKPFLQNIKIYKNENSILVEFDVTQADIEIAKTSTGYGLRMRVKKAETSARKKEYGKKVAEKPKIGENIADISDKYAIMVIFILTLIFILVLIKYFGKKRTFKSSAGFANDVKIVYSKPIDAKNRVTLIEFKAREYLILTGENGNILLDKGYAENSTDDFDSLLKNNSKNLQSYLSQKKSPGHK